MAFPGNGGKRMRTTIFIVFRALVCALLLSSAARADDTRAQQALSGFDAFAEETLKSWNIPGMAVAIVKDGQVVQARGYGVRDAVTNAPMTKDTRFPIASMTKAFTSFTVGLLADDGKLSLDRPVSTYLAQFALQDPIASAGTTLRDMMCHRTGMPRHDAIWYHNKTLTRAGLLERLPYLAPSAPFRAKWQYNNIMFVLAGLAVERVSGQPWERFTQERVFKPLKMARTIFSADEAERDSDHIRGTEVAAGKRVDVPLYRNDALMAPAGGIYSTANDLSRWLLVLTGGGVIDGKKIIEDTTLADLTSLHMPTGAAPLHPDVLPIGYGLGWSVDSYRGRPMIQHGGNLNGVSTLIGVLPNQKLGVVVLTNQSGSELPAAMIRTIIDRFLSLEPIDWTGDALKRKLAGEAGDVAGRANKEASRVKDTRPSHALSAYAGVYSDLGYGDITVVSNGSTLDASYNADRSLISHWHYDVFDGATDDVENIWRDTRVQFQTDLRGRIAALSTIVEPQVAAVVFKKRPEARLFDPKFLSELAGEYELNGVKIRISVSGNKLIITPQGGRPGELKPDLDGEFTHSRRLDVTIRFLRGPDGRVTGFQLIDASGVYEAKRIGA